MKTIFYVVRHGQTLFNKKHRFQGWSDSPLTQEGIDKAKQMGKHLADIEFSLAASSTSERARDTLDYLLNGRDVPTKALKDLREVFFGDMEGEHADKKPAFEIDQKGYAYCGGEDREPALRRFLACLETLAVGGNVLVVGHAAHLSRWLRQLDTSLDPYMVPNQLIPNCSLMKVAYENGQFELLSYPEVYDD